MQQSLRTTFVLFRSLVQMSIFIGDYQIDYPFWATFFEIIVIVCFGGTSLFCENFYAIQVTNKLVKHFSPTNWTITV